MINASELENALKLLSTSEQLVLKAAQPQAKARIFRSPSLVPLNFLYFPNLQYGKIACKNIHANEELL